MAIIRRNNRDYFIKEQKNKLAKVRTAKVCEMCQVEFLANRNTAKYCSDACKSMAYYYRKNYGV